MAHLDESAIKITTKLTIGEPTALPDNFSFVAGPPPDDEQYVSLAVSSTVEAGSLIAGESISGHGGETPEGGTTGGETTGGEATGGETGGSSEEEVVS